MNCAHSNTPSPSKSMDLNWPLATLWNGLKKLESQHQEKKEKLLALLRVKKAISVCKLGGSENVSVTSVIACQQKRDQTHH